MSDTEEGSFDKEAEKEKLREQLRREEEERRSTQHMSELLLKGATMTNKHCDVCGDPLFRYQGQEFCPTCGQEGEAGTSVEAEAEPPGGSTADERPDAGAGITAAGVGGVSESSGVEIDRGATGVDERSTAASAPEPPAARPRPAERPGDVSAARAALVRKLETLARQAEATDDVGRARELLAAAREAAEALAAIDAIRG